MRPALYGWGASVDTGPLSCAEAPPAALVVDTRIGPPPPSRALMAPPKGVPRPRAETRGPVPASATGTVMDVVSPVAPWCPAVPVSSPYSLVRVDAGAAPATGLPTATATATQAATAG